MEDCVFCKIINNQVPAEKTYEDKNVLAFLDINPVQSGHTLVIPKEHHQWMTDVPQDLLAKTFKKSQNLMESIKKATEADFVVLSVVGVDVPHFHIHLIPRFHNDGLANFWPTQKYKVGEDKQIAEKIRNKIN